MKKKFSILALVFLSITLHAQNNSVDSLSIALHQIDSLKQTAKHLEFQINALESRMLVTENNYTALNKRSATNKEEIAALSTQMDTIRELVGINTSTISANEATINSTTESVNQNANKIRNSWILGGVVIALVLIISVLLSLLLHKKGTNEIKDLKKQADEINQKIIDKLSAEADNLKEIAKSVSNQGNGNNDHSLVIALADRITFMEMTLYKMDSHIRGYSHLSKTLVQMKNNLQAYGYVLVDLLGKEYNEGLKATVNYNDDPNIEQGKQIITNIIKPQINYNGTMIQAAQITVSQNI